MKKIIEVIGIVAAVGGVMGLGMFLQNILNECISKETYLDLTKNAQKATILTQENTILTQENQRLKERIASLTGKTIFPIIGGWNTYGGLEVNILDNKEQRIAFNGQFTSAAGYVKEIPSGFPFGGKILTLNIENSAQSLLDQNKMFKLEANGQALRPQESDRINSNDADYVNSGDGTISFQLPDQLTKLEFVFWNSNLNNLTISGTLSDG